MALRQSTIDKYLKIVQAHFYGANKWRIAEELNVSTKTVNQALKWYREKLDEVEYEHYLSMLISETRNHINHLWAYIKRVSDGLPDVVVYKGDITAEIRKHFPAAVVQAHQKIMDLRKFMLFCIKLKHELTGTIDEDIVYDMEIAEPTQDEMEEWELKNLLPEVRKGKK